MTYSFIFFFLLFGLLQIPLVSGVSSLPLSILFLSIIFIQFDFSRFLNIPWAKFCYLLSFLVILAIGLYSIHDPLYFKQSLGTLIFGALSFCFFDVSISSQTNRKPKSFLRVSLFLVMLIYFVLLYLFSPSIFSSMFSLGKSSAQFGISTAIAQESGVFAYAFSINKLLASLVIFIIIASFMRMRYLALVLSICLLSVSLFWTSRLMVFLSPLFLIISSLGVLNSRFYFFSPVSSLRDIIRNRIKKTNFVSSFFIALAISLTLAAVIYKVSTDEVFTARFTGYSQNAIYYELKGIDPPKRILILNSFVKCASGSVNIATSSVHKCIAIIDDYDNTWISAYARGGILSLFSYLFVFAFNLRLFLSFSRIPLLSIFGFIWFVLYSFQADLTNSPILFSPLIIAYAYSVFYPRVSATSRNLVSGSLAG